MSSRRLTRSPRRRGRGAWAGSSGAERLRSLEVDNELEFDGLLDRKIGRACAFQYLVDVDRCTSPNFLKIGRVRHETPGIHEWPVRVDHRQPMLRRKLSDARVMHAECRVTQDEERLDPLPFPYRRKQARNRQAASWPQ